MKEKCAMDYAILSNDKNYTVFRFGNSLEKYTAVKEWDNGYLVVMAKYSHNTDCEEEYIDLVPLLENLYILPNNFLKGIKEVRIENDEYY